MATNSEGSDSLATLRRADFKTALVLIGLATAMLWTALGYPLKDSYGGVENIWYVSPALFPICIAVLLLLLSLVLLGNAIRFATINSQWDFFKNANQFTPGQRALRTSLIVIFIAGYTWLLLPNIDFVVATSLFLLGFTGIFFATDGGRPWQLALSYFGGCVALTILANIVGEQLQKLYIVDWMAILFCAVIFMMLLLQAENKRRVWHALGISIATALIIAVSFRFGLLVPLPHEGIVVDWMHSIRALLR